MKKIAVIDFVGIKAGMDDDESLLIALSIIVYKTFLFSNYKKYLQSADIAEVFDRNAKTKLEMLSSLFYGLIRSLFICRKKDVRTIILHIFSASNVNLAVFFIVKLFSDATFIFLTRDGRETSRSIRRWSSVSGQLKIGVTHDWWGVDNQKWRLLFDKIIAPNPDFAELLADIRYFDNQLDMAAVEWIATMQERIELIRKYPESINSLKYENLIDNSNSALKEVLSFCGLSNDEKVLDYGRQVLRPSAPLDPLDIHYSIRPLFKTRYTATIWK